MKQGGFAVTEGSGDFHSPNVSLLCGKDAVDFDVPTSHLYQCHILEPTAGRYRQVGSRRASGKSLWYYDELLTRSEVQTKTINSEIVTNQITENLISFLQESVSNHQKLD